MPFWDGLFGRLGGVFGTTTSTTPFVGNIGGTFPDDVSARERLTAVVRGTKLIAEDVARLSINVHRDDVAGDNVADPTLDLLMREANPYQTGREWRAWMVSTAIMRGSAYAFIQRTPNGDPVALWPLLPGRITAVWSGFQVEPNWLLDGRAIDPYEIVVLMSGPGNVNNPYLCDSPLIKCAPAMSLAVLQERVATSIASAGRVGKISITHPGTLSQTAKTDLLDAYSRKHLSPEGASRPLVLDEGVKVEKVGDGAMAGLLDERRFAIMEVARALSIPPQMLFQADAGALTSQIEMQRQYVETTVAPWCSRFADALATKLLPRGRRYVFDHYALMRGNLRDTASALKDLSETGAVTVNDAREMLGLSQVATNGDQPIMPADAAREPTDENGI